MTSRMVPLDEWTGIDAAGEVFLRGDPLANPGYRARFEVGRDPNTGLLHVRCCSPLPAGFWLRHVCWQRPEPGLLSREMNTAQFRLDGREM